MSNRSTPGPSHRPSFSPNMPSSTRLQHRQLSSSSSMNQPFPGHIRQSSSFSQRKFSQTSVSGTSTPGASSTYPRRKNNKTLQNVPEGQVDWSALDPDEVFRRLPVGEVKRVESKMRDEALNKQSDLRLMVGTRYRDLLTSATQITALRESSLRLSASLKEAVQSCSTNRGVQITKAESETSEGEEVMSLLPVAAHMKLLLDAPEALYSFLAHHDFLKAAFLWLISRVVKESLAAMPEDVNGPYTPLLSKQWEILLPLRGQIVQRATASLRSREELDSRTLSETLLASILLDNLSIPDALSLFLAQRTKALRDILEPESAGHKRTRRGSRRLSIRSANKERDEIGSVLAESVKSLLETVSFVRAVFDKRPNADSLLDDLQRLVQKGEPLLSPKKELGPRRTSHERRASRLASISLSLPTATVATGGPPVSASQILQNLPSAQILLRHLPTSITAFTPFIAPSPTPDLDKSLESWQQSAIALLQEAGPEWLSGLHSVADMWHVRSSLNTLLGQGQLEREIAAAMEKEWGKRIEAVWESKMKDVVRLVETKTREAVAKIQSSANENDTNPETFVFTELSFPPAPTHALTASAAPFNAFLSVVKKRAALRTPVLDEVLTSLETVALGIRQDMQGLPRSLQDVYGLQVETTLGSLVSSLRVVLEEVEKGDKEKTTESVMMVGRVAIYLSKQSPFLTDLVGESTISLSQVKADLTAVHAESVVGWREKAVSEAMKLLAPIFDPSRGSREVVASWQGPQPVSPSAEIMVALHSLVGATRRLGLPPNSNLPIVEDLIRVFVDQTRGLEGWTRMEEESAVQAAFDLSFLNLFVEKRDDALIQSLLDKTPDSLPGTFKTDLADLIADHLRRTQLLLHPLLRHLKTSSIGPSTAHSSDLRNGLLRFGAPKVASGVGTEFKSPLAVAKPGKRFGLLSVTA